MSRQICLHIIAAGLVSFQIGAVNPQASPKQPQVDAVPIAGITNFLHVPLVDQGTDFTCGVSAMQSVLAYYDPEQSYLEEELVEELQVQRESGLMIGQMEKFARSQGFRVEVVRNMTMERLFSEIRSGRPVIALIQAWPETPGPWRPMVDQGHYVVVNGFDFSNVYVMDPVVMGNYGYMPISEFDERWHHEDDEFGQTERIEHLAIVIQRSGKPLFESGMAVRVH
jgi:predicted double-glycine peptidase